MPKHCTCGKTKNEFNQCDGSHATITRQDAPEPIFKKKDRGNEAFYREPAKPERKQVNISLPVLNIVQTPSLSHDTSIRHWTKTQKGKYRTDEHKKLVDEIVVLQQNGANIKFYVDPDGYYERIYSGSNGTYLTLDQLQSLLAEGIHLAKILYYRKILCGKNGFCKDGANPCSVCSSAMDHDFSFHPKKETEQTESDLETDQQIPPEYKEEIELILDDPRYKIIGSKIINLDDSNSAELKMVIDLATKQKKSLRYILESL